MIMVKGQEDEDGAGLYWEDGTRLTDKEGEAWWAGYNQGHQDGEEDAEEDMLGEIMRLREALYYYADKSHWHVKYGDTYILVDEGRIARAALGEGKE
jgi:hypothetical protein